MRLIVLQGLPGAGKSTMAAELAAALKAKVIAFDDLRKEYPTLPASDLMFVLVRSVGMALPSMDVIVDACNMHPHDRIRWETVAAAYNAEFEWVKIEVPTEECIARDAQRDEPVGEFRIQEMAAEYVDANVCLVQTDFEEAPVRSDYKM